MRMLTCRLVLLALFAVAPLAAQTDVLPPVVRELDSRQRAVAVEAGDARLQSVLQKAFGAHGAYRIVPQDQAAFVFRISPAGGNSVRLDILSGRPLQSLYSETVNGRNQTQAALRAADIAVTKTSGLPGIFAGRITFIGTRANDNELFTGDLLFTEVQQLTHDNANCVRPTLSPDGRTILYTSYLGNGFPDIYKVDLATNRRESFLAFQGVNTGAQYSPNGSRIAVILSGTGNAELYTVNRDGKDMKRLTNNKAIESDPSWSPDGQRIVFASDVMGSKPQLYVVSASGGKMTRLPTNISGYCAEPTWNPVNANLIAFTIAQGSEFEVALFDQSTQQSRVLTNGRGDAVEPVWLRDGRHLVYTERTPNLRRLVLLDTETGKKSYLSDSSWGSSAQADYVYLAR